MTRPLTDEELETHLASWIALNDALSRIEKEEAVHQLLDYELTHRARGMFAFRVHSRLNKLRADRERREIAAVVGSAAKTKLASFKGLAR